jgi:hypothetical protein
MGCLSSRQSKPITLDYFYDYHVFLHYNIAEDYRVNDTLLENIISSYIVISSTNHIFVSIDSTGLLTHASRYYTARTELKRKYVKLSNETDESQ